MSTTVILKDKYTGLKKRVHVLSTPTKVKTSSSSVNTKKTPAETIYLKLDEEGAVIWSKDDKKYYKRFTQCPFEVLSINYPKISSMTLSQAQKKSSSKAFQYLMVHKKTGHILESKIVKTLKDPKKINYTKFFGKRFNEAEHKVTSYPIDSLIKPISQKDPVDQGLSDILQNKKFLRSCAGIVGIWLASLLFSYIDFSSPEPTLIEFQNKEEIQKKREVVKKMITVPVTEEVKEVEKVAQQDPPPKQKKAVNKKNKTSSRSKTVKKQKVASSGGTKFKSNKSRKVKKGSANQARNRKSQKPSKKPSLQDSLFSRTLKKGKIGQASAKADTTKRGSRSGKKGGKGYGSSSSVKGGFVSGKGSSLAASASSRGGTGRGHGRGRGGDGMGSVGMNLSLNGSGSEISGGLTREQINKVVKRNKNDITRCYETREQFNPGMEGNVSVAFSINSRGNVTSSYVKSSNINDKVLNDCLSRKISSWRFDKPVNGVTVQVIYPFNFKSTNIGAL